MDTCVGDSHIVAEVTSLPSAACFWVNYGLPVPWKLILEKFELHLYNHLLDLCWKCCGTDCYVKWRVSGFESWHVHCHCDKKGSLQCLAGAAIKKHFLQDLIIGSNYNLKFPFYRRYVNTAVPTDVIRYEGSIFFRGKHLIYIQLLSQDQRSKDIYEVFFRDTNHYFNSTTCKVILLCTSCVSLTEIAACSCMRNTKKIMLKLLSHMKWLHKSYFRDDKYHEIKRCRLLEKLMFKNCYFTFDDFPQ
ncbi:E4 34K [bat adenovirus 10]|uniref:E4 34K n=1 Tax=bat adenovirus 10 TaxID=3070193 RepID=A0A1X9RIU4_9ADEN|nr:E4 34K [Bat mastadenovirus WIV18]ARQ79796.1 E4 34K [bat adenovirus 10]